MNDETPIVVEGRKPSSALFDVLNQIVEEQKRQASDLRAIMNAMTMPVVVTPVSNVEPVVRKTAYLYTEFDVAEHNTCAAIANSIVRMAVGLKQQKNSMTAAAHRRLIEFRPGFLDFVKDKRRDRVAGKSYPVLALLAIEYYATITSRRKSFMDFMAELKVESVPAMPSASTDLRQLLIEDAATGGKLIGSRIAASFVVANTFQAYCDAVRLPVYSDSSCALTGLDLPTLFGTVSLALFSDEDDQKDTEE